MKQETTQRVLTEQEEQAIRLHHQDFAGFSLENTAAKMGISVKSVKAILRSAKRKAPRMFPILTDRQRAVLLMYDEHLSRKTITESLGITPRMLVRDVAFLRKHGFLFNRTMFQYNEWMDDQIREKF